MEEKQKNDHRSRKKYFEGGNEAAGVIVVFAEEDVKENEEKRWGGLKEYGGEAGRGKTGEEQQDLG